MNLTLQALVPIVMLAGVGLALLGAVLTNLWRKDGVTIGTVFWAGSASGSYPERYVRPERAFFVKCVNLLGVCLFLAGVLMAVWLSLEKLWRT